MKREGCQAGRGGLGCGQQMPGVGHCWLDPTEEVRPQKTLRIRAKQLYWGRNVQGSQTRRLRGPPGGCMARVRRTAAVRLQWGKRTWGTGVQKSSRWSAAGSHKPHQDTAGFRAENRGSDTYLFSLTIFYNRTGFFVVVQGFLCVCAFLFLSCGMRDL